MRYKQKTQLGAEEDDGQWAKDGARRRSRRGRREGGRRTTSARVITWTYAERPILRSTESGVSSEEKDHLEGEETEVLSPHYAGWAHCHAIETTSLGTTCGKGENVNPTNEQRHMDTELWRSSSLLSGATDKAARGSSGEETKLICPTAFGV